MTPQLYALKHNDVCIQERTDWTRWKVPSRPITDLRPEATGEDYLFLPPYENSATAARVFARQFNKLMEDTRLKIDPVLQMERTIYSLRHTAICMRIILSEGKVNIFNLAKHAGTSVEQIERFYARNFPLSPELAKNLQSFWV
jgi:hypothetical protein